MSATSVAAGRAEYVVLGVLGVVAACLTGLLLDQRKRRISSESTVRLNLQATHRFGATSDQSGQADRQHPSSSKVAYVWAKAVVDDPVVELQVPPAEALLGDGLAAALGAASEPRDREGDVSICREKAATTGQQ